MRKLIFTAGLILSAISLCNAQQPFRSNPLEVINNTEEIIERNNIKIPIDNKSEAIRYAELLPSPIVKEYVKKYYSIERTRDETPFYAIFNKETNIWVVSISSGIVDDGLEVEFPPDCAYTNIYPGMGG
jgi:hypothetical protein